MTIEPGCIYRPHPALVPHPSSHRVVVLAVGRRSGDLKHEIVVRYTHHAGGVRGEVFEVPLADFAARWTLDRRQ